MLKTPARILLLLILFKYSLSISGQVLIDKLIGDYLKAEQDLWRVIEKREPTTLQQIYDTHTHFLKISHGQSNIFLNNLDPRSNPVVITGIIDINQTSHSIAKQFFIHRNYTALSLVAMRGIEIDKVFQAILDETVNTTAFWESIHNTTLECQPQTRIVQSEHQEIFEYYKDIQAAALRTYITSQLSYMILHLHESGNFREQSLQYRSFFRERSKNTSDIFKGKLGMANRELRTCDPVDYQMTDASFEVTNFLQNYVDSEVNINADASCKLTCDDYKKTKHFGCRTDTFCANENAQRRKALGCNGIVRECRDSEDDLSICPTDDGTTRYKYIKSSHGLLYGNNTRCSNELTASAWIRWFVKCSNCRCLCDDITHSDRYFSLRNVVSNINENKIVTGVAITKINRIIQLSIAQRELKPNGNIDYMPNDNIQWISSPVISLEDNKTLNGIDYHTLSYENRSLDLDTLIAPVGQVVTGVRFYANAKGHLSIQIRVTDIDVTAGRLINLSDSIWLSNPNGGKKKIDIKQVDVSSKTRKESMPNNETNAYVKFGPTEIKLDIAQRTVPFLEGLKVEPKVPVPLAGVGLYYKGASGFGGFVAPKIVVYDFEPYIGSYDN